MLAMLCACARDPLLRLSAPVVLNTPLDGVVTAQQFRDHLRTTAPDRFSANTLKSMRANLLSSWTQSGHLAGKKERRRVHPKVSPEATAYALLLGRRHGPVQEAGEFGHCFALDWAARTGRLVA